MTPHTPPRHPHRQREILKQWEREQAEQELAADAARIRGERRKSDRIEKELAKLFAGVWGAK